MGKVANGNNSCCRLYKLVDTENFAARALILSNQRYVSSTKLNCKLITYNFLSFSFFSLIFFL